MTKDELKKLDMPLRALGAAFRVEMTEPLTLAYVLAFEDLALEKVVQAIKWAIRTGGDFIPTPSRLRTMAGAYSAPYHKPWNPPRFEPREEWPQLTEALKPEEPK